VKHREDDAGFTLIEALIATALMGAILAALATVTAQWLPNWNRGFARVQRAEQVGFGIERVVADLAATEFVPAGRGSNDPWFDGGQLGVTFARTALGPNARPGALELVQIAEIGAEGGLVLVRRRAPLVPITQGVNDRDPPAFSDQVVLLRPPYRVSFSYAGPDRVWNSLWHGQKVLPRAVRISVRDAATERTVAVSTATLVHTEIPAFCLASRSIAECMQQGQPAPAQPAGDQPSAGRPGGAPREL
jgi:general secretion pathway protein J